MVSARLPGWLFRVGGSRSCLRSGGHGYSAKLDAGDGDPWRRPIADRRSRLACLLLGLEQDDREALAVGRLQPVAGDKTRGSAHPWQDVVHECLGCRRGLLWIDRQSHKRSVHGPSSQRFANGTFCSPTSGVPTSSWISSRALSLMSRGLPFTALPSTSAVTLP